MARYIDIEELSQMVYENFGRDGEFDYRDLIRILREQPTADVKEVVHGKWIRNENSSFIVHKAICKCNLCECEFPDEENFCPNCGADMR